MLIHLLYRIISEACLRKYKVTKCNYIQAYFTCHHLSKVHYAKVVYKLFEGTACL